MNPQPSLMAHQALRPKEWQGEAEIDVDANGKLLSLRNDEMMLKSVPTL